MIETEQVNDLLSPEQMLRMAAALEKQGQAHLEAAKQLRTLAETTKVSRLTPEGRKRISEAAKAKWERERAIKMKQPKSKGA